MRDTSSPDQKVYRWRGPGRENEPGRLSWVSAWSNGCPSWPAMLDLTACGGFRPERPFIGHGDWLCQSGGRFAGSAPHNLFLFWPHENRRARSSVNEDQVKFSAAHAQGPGGQKIRKWVWPNSCLE